MEEKKKNEDLFRYCRNLRTEEEVETMFSSFPAELKDEILGTCGRFRIAGGKSFIPQEEIDTKMQKLWCPSGEDVDDDSELSKDAVKIMNLTDELDAARNRLAEAEDKIRELEKEHSKLAAETRTDMGGQETAAQLQLKIDCIREQYGKLRQEYNENKAYLAEVKAEFDRAVQKCSELEVSADSWKEMYEKEKALASENGNANHNLTDDAGMSEKNAEINRLTEKIESLKSELADARKAVESYESDTYATSPMKKLQRDCRTKDKEILRYREELTNRNNELEETRRNLESIKESSSVAAVLEAREKAESWEALAEECQETCNGKDRELAEARDRNKELKSELDACRMQNEQLTESLNQKGTAKASSSELADIDLFYPEELTDFILYLARRNLDRLESSKDEKKREYDLSRALVESITESGFQANNQKRLAQAVRTYYDGGRVVDLIRYGFKENTDGNGAHRKFIYGGSPRYTAVFASTPSGSNTTENAIHSITNMLLFDGERR